MGGGMQQYNPPNNPYAYISYIVINSDWALDLDINENTTSTGDHGLEAFPSLTAQEDPGEETPPSTSRQPETKQPPPKGRLIGLPYTTVSVREPKIDTEKSRFVYNFYTEDERLGKEEKGMSVTSNDFVTRQEVLDANVDLRGIPRLNHIVFEHAPDLYNTAGHKELGSFIKIGPRNLINKFKQNATNTSGELVLRPDRIIAEGTFANMFYKSATLLETSLDSKVYKAFHDQMRFFELIDGAASASGQELNTIEFNDRIDAYKQRTEEHGQYLNANLVRNFINQLSKSGQQVIDSETDLTLKDSFMQSVRQQSFLTGFRSTLIDDVIKASIDDSTNVFEDELRAMKNHTEKAQVDAVEFEKAQLVNSSFFNNILGLGFLYDYTVEPLTEFGIGNIDYPHVEHIGYVVQKVEITKGENDLPGRLIQNQAKFYGQQVLDEIIDTEVTYGRSYTYKIRSVSAVEYDFLITMPSGVPMKVRGLFFVGSKNSTINLKAVETIPPKPPNVLRFNYQRNKGMLIEWNHPHNPQRDIVGYHVYRRSDTYNNDGDLIKPAMQKSFTLIREINFDKSIIKTDKHEKALLEDTDFVNNPQPWYLDKDFNNDSKFIYAVVSFDAHGLTSNYSPQYEVTYDRPTNKIIVKSISKRFAPKAYPNMFFNLDANISDVFKDNFKVSDKKRLTVYFNPDYYHMYKSVIQGALSTTPTPNGGVGSKLSTGTSSFNVGALNNGPIAQHENLNLIQTSTEREEPVYRIHMINIDLQKDEILDICIGDESTKEFEIPVPLFEENNFSFEMLHPSKYTQ
jgi:hypothetical protein